MNNINEPISILKKYYGYDDFREGQESVINTILEGNDCLAIMPTGAGKSICYQIPALMFDGITIVISPLISLMQDQVKALKSAQIEACYINSYLTDLEIAKVFADVSAGKYKIMYVSPERLDNVKFWEYCRSLNISMVTVDEAHCLSQWGQDFRPSYLRISEFVKRLPKRPVVSGFTATATAAVKNDIIKRLELINPQITSTGYDRTNLYYRVEATTKKEKYIVDYILQHQNQAGIIYCATRKNVEKIYEALIKADINATMYHAGLSNSNRKKNQDDFIYDRKDIIVATNAFGMGIDKSNVRFVIHYNMPQSIENYYQEAGRAGRDGEEAECTLLFSSQDIVINKFLLENKDFSNVSHEDVELVKHNDSLRLKSMIEYCQTTSCLRDYILTYFGENKKGDCNKCGNCSREYKVADMKEQAKWVINCVAETKGSYGINVVIKTLRGARSSKLIDIGAVNYKSYGRLKDETEVNLRTLINQMICDGLLVQTDSKYSVLRMGNIDRLKQAEPYNVKQCKSVKKKAPSNNIKDKKDETLFELLRKLRLRLAKEEGMPPYIVFSDKTLVDMVNKCPKTIDEFLDVSGVGQAKAEKYGDEFIGAIVEYSRNSSKNMNLHENDC
ncbi:ATP-dependent DNA helicase RecQ [Pseudobutyrivibrio sp. OR37]|uniref:DNA helicase RecQ n=1 Tax=Pseudobutyrivibrio sp. OR37 TaxID=1798186 RepID=UPI0008E92871|nr:DNA helicase RecQ [Pseudobutyrivibrio sp. OR37]SFI17498.1 ATP-dependent DNA helicase RecQ [Pseudobutyrivibrio sp. OR37]